MAGAEEDEQRRSHPIFDRIDGMPRGVVEAFAERRIREGREAGLFDDLAGHGKPIPDIDRQRKAGWWAERFVARERHSQQREELLADVRRAMPALWRMPDEQTARAEVKRLNAQVDEYNRVTTTEPVERLDAEATVATWRRLRA